MTTTSKEDILNALKSITLPKSDQNPDSANNIVDADMIATAIVDNGKVGLVIDMKNQKVANPNELKTQAEAIIKSLEGITEVTVVLTAERAANAAEKNTGQPAPGAAQGPKPLKGVKHVIAVASGKGGVGKSTTSVNLALALKAQGLAVGILDADIFGPSLPLMVGTDKQKPKIVDNVIQPVMAHGIKTMSIGYLLMTDQPIVWRGPKVMGAVQQLFNDVAWGPIDVLIVDLPPGTGDVQISMVQQIKLSGAVIVSTPQDLALMDARKGLSMFQMVNIPILGVIENMSHYHCPKCGERADIFGHGGARAAAEELKCHFLGEIPLDMSIRVQGDTGSPVVVSDPKSDVAAAYLKMADDIIKTLD